MINGRLTKFLKLSRGLRKVCPLSPLLYILMEEALSRALEETRRSKAILEIQITNRAKRINHSQFADDTLLLGGFHYNCQKSQINTGRVHESFRGENKPT
jgi:hypothetical protein